MRILDYEHKIGIEVLPDAKKVRSRLSARRFNKRYKVLANIKTAKTIAVQSKILRFLEITQRLRRMC